MISKAKADFIRTLADATGHIEPGRVVAAARPADSIIHDEFNWDPNAAAMNHWMDTARGLIRFVKLEVMIERQTVIAPYYVPDPEREPKSKRYCSLNSATRDAALAKSILLAELDRIVQLIRRAQQIAAVLGLADELAELLDNVTELKTAAERKAEEEEKKKPKAGGKRRAKRGHAEARA
jgi:hypothetical protein